MNPRELDKTPFRPNPSSCVEVPNWVVVGFLGLLAALFVTGWVAGRYDDCERVCIVEHGQLRASWLPWVCECRARPEEDVE